MAYSDRTYVGTGPGPGPEWVTVYYVKSSHCDLCGNLNGSYTLAMYWSWSWSRSHSHISSVWKSHHSGSRQSHPIHQVWTCPYPSLSPRCGPPRSQADRQTAAQCEYTLIFKPGIVVHPGPKQTAKQQHSVNTPLPLSLGLWSTQFPRRPPNSRTVPLEQKLSAAANRRTPSSKKTRYRPTANCHMRSPWKVTNIKECSHGRKATPIQASKRDFHCLWYFIAI